MAVCEHVLSGCARGSGGWEYIFIIQFMQFRVLGIYIFHISVYAICCLNESIWIAYVGRGRCSSSMMM